MDYKKLIGNYFFVYDAEYPSFRKAAKYGTGFIVLGLFLLYMQYIQVFKNVQIMSVIFILIGVFSFWLWIRPFFFLKRIFYTRPADGDMDIWFHDAMHDIIKPRALDLLRINPSSLKDENIILVPYPIDWKIPGLDALEMQKRSGDDKKDVYSVWGVQILVVTDNFISYYSCVFDWITDEIFSEKTNEYFFDDISSVRNDDIELDYVFYDSEDKKVGTARVFKLTNMSGDSLTVITDIPGMNVPEGYSNNLERLVQALRLMLRNRRYGETIEPAKEHEPEHQDTDNHQDIQISEQKTTVLFHQELRKIHEDYSKEMDELRRIKNKEYRG